MLSSSDFLKRLVQGAVLWAALGASGAAKEISPNRLDVLPRADVLLLGEVHDNPEHHLNQARALRAFGPRAVVFEMLDPKQAERANGDLRGAELAEAIGWAESGWPDFAIYAPVFDAVGGARVYGMALPREDVRRALTEGASQVFGAEADKFGLGTPLPAEEQAEREAGQIAAHCDALPAEMAAGMVDAQRLRDTAFARTVLRALDETGGPVAVIAGTGHVRYDWGIPAALRRAAPDVTVLSIGQLEASGAASENPPFDMWIVTEPVDRPDPCAAFGAG